MRKLILSMMVSLDGMIARANRDLDWHLTDDEFERDMLDLLRSVDAILLGRVSYQLLADYWPSAGTAATKAVPGEYASKEHEIEFAHLMNSIPKIVFSRTLTEAQWGPATIMRDVRAEEIARLKQQPGKDLVLFAGADIASTFIDLDLFDEYRLLVHPLILGTGLPLFKDGTQERKLRLARTKRFESGVVVLQYDRDS